MQPGICVAGVIAWIRNTILLTRLTTFDSWLNAGNLS